MSRTLVRVLLVFLLSALLGCESVVDVPLPRQDPQLVVLSVIEEGLPWRVRLQRAAATGTVVPGWPAAVEDATVTVTGNDGTAVRLAHRGGGFYVATTSRPRAGVTYTLRAEAPGFPTALATDTVPDRITPVLTHAASGDAMGVAFDDAGGATNYYELFVLVGAGSQLRRLELVVRNPELEAQIESMEIQDPLDPTPASTLQLQRVLLHDEPFDGQRVLLDLGLSDTHGGATTIYFCAVSAAYYHYERTKRLQQMADNNPFIEPVHVRSNIQGGQGLFAARTTSASGPLSPATLHQRVAGTYRLAEYSGKVDGQPVDYIREGASGTLTLHDDFTVTGTLLLPAAEPGGTVRQLALDGGYTLQEGTVWLFHSADTALKDMAFQFNPSSRTLFGSVSASLSQSVRIRWSR